MPKANGNIISDTLNEDNYNKYYRFKYISELFEALKYFRCSLLNKGKKKHLRQQQQKKIYGNY